MSNKRNYGRGRLGKQSSYEDETRRIWERRYAAYPLKYPERGKKRKTTTAWRGPGQR